MSILWSLFDGQFIVLRPLHKVTSFLQLAPPTQGDITASLYSISAYEPHLSLFAEWIFFSILLHCLGSLLRVISTHVVFFPRFFKLLATQIKGLAALDVFLKII